jgi:hypothetical protein
MLCIISHAGFLAAIGNVKHNKSNSMYSMFCLKSCIVYFEVQMGKYLTPELQRGIPPSRQRLIISPQISNGGLC